MTDMQKLIKYLAIAFAVFLIVCIFTGILTAATAITGIFRSVESNTSHAMQSFSVSADIAELEINIGAAELIITNGEQFSLSSNLKDLKVEQRNGCLTLKEPLQFGKNYNGAVIQLTVPEDHVFGKLSISSGAGKLQADTLATQSLALNLGAGQAIFRDLTAHGSAMISTGAGELQIKAGALSNLDLDMGVGKVTLCSRLSGENEINQGIGEAELILFGVKEDYRVHIDKGVGNAFVDGTPAASDTKYGNGPAEVEIDGGIGTIRVSFSK